VEHFPEQAIFFMEAFKPLVKAFFLGERSELSTSAYPMMKRFKSHKITLSSLQDFANALQRHAKLGHCVLKGKLNRDLDFEDRRSATSSLDATRWVCFDLDAAPFKTPDEFMSGHPLLKDVSYIVQYSASEGFGKPGLRCHIFMLLDNEVKPDILRAWLLSLNLNGDLFKGIIRQKSLKLNAAGTTLHFPIDISSCQNDRLLFIAPPIIGKGVKYNPPKPAIVLVKKKLEYFPVERLPQLNIAELKADQRAIVNFMRKERGLHTLRATRFVDGYEVQGKPGELNITGTREDDEFIRLNFNGGDSWAYWHPKQNFELIHSFKGEPSLVTKDVCPEYYKECIAKARETAALPTEDGEVILGVCDKRSAALVKLAWNPSTQILQLYPAKNEKQLADWLLQHDKIPGEFTPQWNFDFNPRNPTIIDVKAQYLNTYVPSTYRREFKRPATPPTPADFPLIRRIIASMVSDNTWNDVTEHLMNWLAVIFQHNIKTGTAWLMHGVEGCLAGDAVLNFSRGYRSSGRDLTIKEAYEKFNGLWVHKGRNKGKDWDRTIPTRTRSVKDDMTVGFHEIYRIVESGEQQLYKLTTDDGDTIRATEKHPFMREDGSFTELCSLKQGDVVLKRGEKNAHTLTPHGRNKRRVTIHSIPHHPFAWQHVINGKNYKRCHKARLVFEAWLNNLEFDEFIKIIRTDAEHAKTLEYLDPSWVIHHLDEDCSNDNLSNLTVVDKENHDQHHAKTTGLGTVLTRPAKIVSIVKDKVEMTYDITMKAPYHNYVANNFCVSNTGKGLFVNNVLRPLIGMQYVKEITLGRLEDGFNGWLERTLICFVDELQVSSSQHNKIVAGLLRNWITEPNLDIRNMQQVAYNAPNYTNFIIGSNKPDPVEITDTDRRYNIGEFQKTKLVISQVEIDSLPNELQAFFNYLMCYPADIQRSRTVIHTEGRRNVIDAGRNVYDMLADAILDGDLSPFVEALPDLTLLNTGGQDTATKTAYHSIIMRELEALCSSRSRKLDNYQVEGRLTRDELHVLFSFCAGTNTPESPGKFTRMLKHKGIELKRLRTTDGVLTYGVRPLWTAPAAWVAEYTPEKQRIRRIK
jgi:hypothetical protein